MSENGIGFYPDASGPKSGDGDAARLQSQAVEFSWLIFRTPADLRGTLLRLMGEALEERGLPRIARDLNAAATEYPEHVSLRYVHVNKEKWGPP